jgi:hypothetical protein
MNNQRDFSFRLDNDDPAAIETEQPNLFENQIGAIDENEIKQ